ncbi:MAG: ketoacyl-ACP synthase III [Gammaproteobacteria bacterium]|nr:ketoacyl-ACP synthase III [Gammaproteobacteria bacterium]
MFSRIIGTGRQLPERVVSNRDLEGNLDTSEEWIRERTGIERRHIAADGETTVDLAEGAAREALKAAGRQAADVDFIVFGTTTPDLVFPNCGALLQARLGIRGCAALGIEAACSGFIYALSIADKYVRCGEAKCALVVGAETLSRITDWNDRGTAILFGDGAGAVLLAPSEEPGILSTHLHADGSHGDLLFATGGVSRGFNDPPGRGVIRMRGHEVFRLAVNALSSIVEETLHRNGLEAQAIDWFVPHQANLRIIQAIARKLGLPMERVIVTIQDQGNTSAASVPMALDTGIRDGRIRPGHLVLCEAFGGGFTWGSALIRM